MRRLVMMMGVALLLPPATAPAQDVPTQKEPIPPVAELAGVVYVTDVELSVNGRRVDAAPPGDPVVATVGIVNGGTERITNVRITVSAADDEARLTRAAASVGDLDPRETGRAEIELVVRPERCNDFIGLAGEVTFDGGSSPIKVGIPVGCPGPRLWLEKVEFEGGDGDGVPEPGETLRMFVTLRNEGRDPAAGVKAHITVRGEGVSAKGTDLAWRDVAAGATQQSLAGVVVTVSESAPPQEGCKDLPLVEPAPDKDAPVTTLPPDSSVASDGTVSPPSSSGSGSGRVPGSAGSGEPASPGPDVIVDPAPGTIEPLPAPNETGTDGREPAPAPIEPAPNPEPARDLPIRLDVQVALSAAEYSTALEYSTAMICAFREGEAGDALGRPALAAQDDAGSGQGGAALPLAVAFLVSAAAVGARAVLIG